MKVFKNNSNNEVQVNMHGRLMVQCPTCRKKGEVEPEGTLMWNGPEVDWLESIAADELLPPWLRSAATTIANMRQIKLG